MRTTGAAEQLSMPGCHGGQSVQSTVPTPRAAVRDSQLCMPHTHANEHTHAHADVLASAQAADYQAADRMRPMQTQSGRQDSLHVQPGGPRHSGSRVTVDLMR